MLSFENDYSEGAHYRILKRLVDTDMEPASGYGSDPYCEEAKSRIREAIELPDAQITFLVGGTQTNRVVISTMTAPYQGVVSAETGHVNVHEGGAIENSGRKVLALPAHNGGKLDPDEVKAYFETFYQDGNHEHMVFPGMVYISHPTEYGALYSKEELTRLRAVCDEYQVPMFMDGARLGYGLMSPETDVTLPDIAKLTDVFYIGGTKVGALCGEAVVFTRNNEPAHFVTQIKQQGALLAKGRLLGIQFAELFTDGLYYKLGRNGVRTAMMLRKVLHDKGYEFFFESPTNQQFVIIDNDKMTELKEKVRFSYMEKYDETHTVIRFCTSWATRRENVEKLAEML